MSEEKNKLWDVCKQFIEENEIGRCETVYQCDRVILNASEFIESICDIVGYIPSEDEFEDEDDDEDF